MNYSAPVWIMSVVVAALCLWHVPIPYLMAAAVVVTGAIAVIKSTREGD